MCHGVRFYNKSGYTAEVYASCVGVWGTYFHKVSICSGESRFIYTPDSGLHFKIEDPNGRDIATKRKLYRGSIIIDVTGLKNGNPKVNNRRENWNRPLTLDEKIKLTELGLKIVDSIVVPILKKGK